MAMRPVDPRSEPPGIESERRAAPRIEYEIEVSLDSESHFFTGLSGDISEGGLFVSTYRTFSKGELIPIQFQLTPGKMIRATARVAWIRETSAELPPGVGLQFESLSEEDRAQIASFCAARAPLYYDVEDEPLREEPARGEPREG